MKRNTYRRSSRKGVLRMRKRLGITDIGYYIFVRYYSLRISHKRGLIRRIKELEYLLANPEIYMIRLAEDLIELKKQLSYA